MYPLAVPQFPWAGSQLGDDLQINRHPSPRLRPAALARPHLSFPSRSLQLPRQTPFGSKRVCNAFSISAFMCGQKKRSSSPRSALPPPLRPSRNPADSADGSERRLARFPRRGLRGAAPGPRGAPQLRAESGHGPLDRPAAEAPGPGPKWDAPGGCPKWDAARSDGSDSRKLLVWVESSKWRRTCTSFEACKQAPMFMIRAFFCHGMVSTPQQKEIFAMANQRTSTYSGKRVS